MKKTVCLFAVMILGLFVTGCDNDNPVEPANPSPANSPLQLDIMAYRFYTEGIESLVAGDSLIKLFPDLTPEIINRALFNAGYSPEDIVKILNFCFEKYPAETEIVLMNILTGFTNAQIASLIIKGYKDYLLNHEDELIYFIKKIPELSERIKLLKEEFNKELPGIIILLRKTGAGIIEVLKAAEEQFVINSETVLSLINELRLNAEEAASLMKVFLDMTSSQAAAAFQELNYDLSDIVEALKEVYDNSYPEIYDVLQSLRISLQNIITAFRATQITLSELNDLLVNKLNIPPAEAADVLHNSGYSFDEIIKFLKDNCRLSFK